MHIVVACATQRGMAFLEKLVALAPDARLTVFSFREDPWEPPFLDQIRTWAEPHDAQVFETRRVHDPKWAAFWAENPVDLMFSVSWRYLIPADIYLSPRLGTFIFHDSLLPQYRGFAPTVWAMVNGEPYTGATLFEIADDVDSGPIVGQQRVDIGPHDTIAQVMTNVTAAYLTLLETYLPALMAGTAPRTPQNQAEATFTCKRLPEDNKIDWTQPTQVIYNLIRATTSPYPGAFTTLEGQKLIIWGTRMVDQPGRYVGRIPGRVVEIRPGEGVVVMTGDSLLLLTQVQLGDALPQPAEAIVNKISFTLGRGPQQQDT